MASRTLLALTTPVAAHAIAQTAYHRREPMHAPEAIDESGRCPDRHAAARLGNAETASATPAWATARRTSSTLTARPVRHPAAIALPHPRLADDRLPGWRSPCGARREEEEASIVNAWTLVRFIHVLSAMVWVGGQLLLSLLVLPVLRRQLDTASRSPLTREVGVRFGIFTSRSSCRCSSRPGSHWPPTAV